MEERSFIQSGGIRGLAWFATTGVIILWILSASMNGVFNYFSANPAFQLYPFCFATGAGIFYLFFDWIQTKCIKRPWLMMVPCIAWVLLFVLTTKAVDRREALLHPPQPPPRQVLSARLRGFEDEETTYSPDKKTAGILWKKEYIPARIDLKSEDREVRNLDFRILLDRGETMISDVGVFNGLVNMRAMPTGEMIDQPPGGMSIQEVVLSGRTTNGGRWAIPIDLERGKMSANIWRVWITRLPPNSTITLLIAGEKSNFARGRVRHAEMIGTIEVTTLQGVNTNAAFHWLLSD